MRSIMEHVLFAKYSGENVNKKRLSELSLPNGKGTESYTDSNEYVIMLTGMQDDPYYSHLFRMTQVLKKSWNINGVAIDVHLYVRDGSITGGRIVKYKHLPLEPHPKALGYETDPSQQELRIISRIFAYITTEEKQHEN